MSNQKFTRHHMEKAINYIKDNAGNTGVLKRASAKFGISKSVLCTNFQIYEGISIGAWRHKNKIMPTNQKIDGTKIVEQLKEESIEFGCLTKIANQFNVCPATVSLIFKKHEGITFTKWLDVNGIIQKNGYR